jgi:hypothetical protein
MQNPEYTTGYEILTTWTVKSTFSHDAMPCSPHKSSIGRSLSLTEIGWGELDWTGLVSSGILLLFHTITYVMVNTFNMIQYQQ